MEISGTIINLNIFRCSVVILVAPDKDSMLKGLPKLYKKWGCSKENLEKDLDIIRDALDTDKEDIYKGTTIKSGIDSLVLFIEEDIQEVTEETSVHELYHAMRQICDAHGVDDEETEAYMLEYLCNQFWTAQDDWRDNHPKDKEEQA